jgi:uncharacterized protein YndB with AHSA1/START domain
MGPISLRIDVDAPRERVFDFICDLANRPGWTDHFIHEYRLERIPPTGQGAAARFRVNGPPGIHYMELVIAKAERPHLIEETGRGGRWDRVPIRAAWELTEEAAVTEVRFTFWTEPANHFDKLRERGRSRWWRRRWARALRRMRELIEAGDASAERAVVAGIDLPAS